MDNQDLDLFEDISNFPNWVDDAALDKFEESLGLIKTAAELTAKREMEHKLLSSFKSNPNQQTFMPLYNSMKPLILTAVSRNSRGSTIPQAAHMAFAAQNFLDSIKTFDPAKGSFRTHAFNHVAEKGKRLNLKYQNIGTIPEHRATKYQVYQTAVHLLREELGREPSTLEIADECNMPVREIETLRSEVKKDLIAQEHMVSKGLGFAQTDKAMQVARDVLYSLEPKHQLVLEYSLGLNGKTPLLKKVNGMPDLQAIAKAANISIADVRNARKVITRKFNDYKAFMGKGENPAQLFEDLGEE